MTISSTTNRLSFAGNGVTVAFATSPVVFFDSADLTVYEVITATGVSTLKTLTTDYTVTGGSGTTGTVTMLVAPATGTTLVIVRDVAITQESDFVNNDASDAEVIEDAFDRLTMEVQQLDARVDRSLRLDDSDVSGTTLTIPDATTRAGTVIGFDAAGAFTYLAAQTATSLVNLAASGGSALIGWIQSGTGAILRTLQAKLRETYSITDFGALGDGTTDSSAYLVAAEAAAFAAGRSLYVPDGTFIYSGAWSVRVNVYGTGTVKQKSTSSIASTPTVTIAAASVTVSGITVDGNSKRAGIRSDSLNDITVREVNVQNCVYGAVSFYLGNRVRAIRCTASNIQYVSPGSSGGAADGFYAGGCYDVLFESCVASNFRRIGFVAEQEGATQSDMVRMANCTAYNANNCGDSTTEYNAAFWAENTNNADIVNCVGYDIAGNAGQSSNRVFGIAASGGSTAGVINIENCRLGDTTGTLPIGIDVGGTGTLLKVNIRGCTINTYSTGVGIVSSPDSVTISDLLLLNGTSNAGQGGILIDGTSGTCNNISITRVKELGQTYSSNDSGTINTFAAFTAGDRVLSIIDCHACTLVTRQPYQKIFVSDSEIQRRSATYGIFNAAHVYLDNSRITYFTGGSTLFGSSNASEAYCSNSRFESFAVIAGNGSTGFQWEFVGCNFDACTISWDGSGTRSMLKISDSVFNNGPAIGCIIASGVNATKDTVIVQNSSFYATNVANTPIVVGSFQPDLVLLHGNNYNTTTFTTLVGGTVNSQVSNIQTL